MNYILRKGLPTSRANVSNRVSEFRKDERAVRAELGKEDKPAETDMVCRVVEQPPPMYESELDVRDFVAADQLSALTEQVKQISICLARSTTEIFLAPITKMRTDLTNYDSVKYRPYRLSCSEGEVVRDMAI